MITTIDPTYPSPGDIVTISTVGEAGGDVFVYALTGAPSASALETGLLLIDHAGDPPGGAFEAARLSLQAAELTPDVGGAYTLAVYELRSRPGDGAFSLVALDTFNLEVLTFLDIELVTVISKGATIRLGIVDTGEGGIGYVRTAELTLHQSEASRLAAQQATVIAAVTAMVDDTTSDVLGEQLTRADDLRAMLQVTKHYDDATWHTAPDTDNVVTRISPKSAAELIAQVNACRTSLVQHMSAVSLAGGGVHTNDDTSNSVVLAPAVTGGQAAALLAHLRTVYQRHRVRGSGATPPVHLSAGGDTTNVLVEAVTPLETFVAAYCDALEDTVPTAAAQESAGVAYALQNTGMHAPRGS